MKVATFNKIEKVIYESTDSIGLKMDSCDISEVIDLKGTSGRKKVKLK